MQHTADLFTTSDAPEADHTSVHTPLAARMRPRTLDDFVGQEHVVGEGKLLRRAIEADRVSSVILYGPPGCGKTALAHIMAERSQAAVERINAVTAGVTELRASIQRAKERQRLHGHRTILFIDEIHRFNKSQQDCLMPDVEAGNPILIGATTENPFFALVAALLSRSIVVECTPLSVAHLTEVLRRAIADDVYGLGAQPLRVDDAAIAHWATVADGDARRALNALEIAATTTRISTGGKIHITQSTAEESIQKKAVVYDHHGDAHYDTASAFIKSMRGSDPDAALYWLAKMLYAGEDPRFIARRVVICAAEDVGNADPQALVLANAAAQVTEFVGMPECRIPLAQAVSYIAAAPKSNAAYVGIEKAMEDVEHGKTIEVPMHLRDGHYAGAKRLGHGKDYQYAHDAQDHYVAQEYAKTPRPYYEPTDQGAEGAMKERLDALRARTIRMNSPT
jgi:putative ATPase